MKASRPEPTTANLLLAAFCLLIVFATHVGAVMLGFHWASRHWSELRPVLGSERIQESVFDGIIQGEGVVGPVLVMHSVGISIGLLAYFLGSWLLNLSGISLWKTPESASSNSEAA